MVGSKSPVDVVEVPVEVEMLLEVVDEVAESVEVEEVEALVLDLCSELLVDALVCVLEVCVDVCEVVFSAELDVVWEVDEVVTCEVVEDFVEVVCTSEVLVGGGLDVEAVVSDDTEVVEWEGAPSEGIRKNC